MSAGCRRVQKPILQSEKRRGVDLSLQVLTCLWASWSHSIVCERLEWTKSCAKFVRLEIGCYLITRSSQRPTKNISEAWISILDCLTKNHRDITNLELWLSKARIDMTEHISFHHHGITNKEQQFSTIWKQNTNQISTHHLTITNFGEDFESNSKNYIRISPMHHQHLWRKTIVFIRIRSFGRP